MKFLPIKIERLLIVNSRRRWLCHTHKLSVSYTLSLKNSTVLFLWIIQSAISPILTIYFGAQNSDKFCKVFRLSTIYLYNVTTLPCEIQKRRSYCKYLGNLQLQLDMISEHKIKFIFTSHLQKYLVHVALVTKKREICSSYLVCNCAHTPSHFNGYS